MTLFLYIQLGSMPGWWLVS